MTAIEWTHLPGYQGRSWNPVVGCSVTSPGCTHCYAMKQAARIEAMQPGRTAYTGTTRRVNGKPVWTGRIGEASARTWEAPLRARKPACWFVNSMGDLFHPNVTDAQIDRAFAVIMRARRHRFIILTKQAERMRNYMNALADCHARAEVDGEWFDRGFVAPLGHLAAPWPLPNVALGVSAEDQRRADERIPHLLATPAAVRLVSCEPLLGPIDLTWLAQPNDDADGVFDSLRGLNWVSGKHYVAADGREGAPLVRLPHRDLPGDVNSPRLYITKENVNPEHWEPASFLPLNKLDWIIAGGESGPRARPMHPDWVRSLRDQCAAAGTPFFFKQWGEWLPFDDAINVDGADVLEGEIGGFGGDDPGGNPQVLRVGKKLAGHTLDGQTHQHFPEAWT